MEGKAGVQNLSFPVSPGRVVNDVLGLVFGELIGLKLVDRGDSRPAVFCGSACGGTFNQPC